MNAPSYLNRLREKKQKNTRYTGTAQTAKTNLCSLRSSDLGHKSSFFSDDAKATLPEPTTAQPVTSWAWRIIRQDGTLSSDASLGSGVKVEGSLDPYP